MKCATGFLWKKKSRKGKSNSTPGKVKGENCQADWRKKYYFCAARAYKDPMYTTYLKISKKLVEGK